MEKIKAHSNLTSAKHTHTIAVYLERESLMNCLQLLREASERNRSLLCVGLDPDMRRIPVALLEAEDPFYAFCIAIVDATADLACAFKPNIAFFEALGPGGTR